MSTKIPLRKTYSVYASEIHLSTMIFPFVKEEIEKGAIIKPILEKNISTSISKIINNVGINSKLKEKIDEIDWEQTNIEKIKKVLKEIEEKLNSKNVHIIILGSNLFIEKVNELVDIWTKVNLSKIELSNNSLNIINCYRFEENDELECIEKKHQYLLNTLGIHEIYNKKKKKKAN